MAIFSHMHDLAAARVSQLAVLQWGRCVSSLLEQENAVPGLMRVGPPASTRQTPAMLASHHEGTHVDQSPSQFGIDRAPCNAAMYVQLCYSIAHILSSRQVSTHHKGTPLDQSHCEHALVLRLGSPLCQSAGHLWLPLVICACDLVPSLLEGDKTKLKVHCPAVSLQQHCKGLAGATLFSGCSLRSWVHLEATLQLQPHAVRQLQPHAVRQLHKPIRQCSPGQPP